MNVTAAQIREALEKTEKLRERIAQVLAFLRDHQTYEKEVEDSKLFLAARQGMDACGVIHTGREYSFHNPDRRVEISLLSEKDTAEGGIYTIETLPVEMLGMVERDLETLVWEVTDQDARTRDALERLIAAAGEMRWSEKPVPPHQR